MCSHSRLITASFFTGHFFVSRENEKNIIIVSHCNTKHFSLSISHELNALFSCIAHAIRIITTTMKDASPGERLHQAIAHNDLETCRHILACPLTGPATAVHKNFRGNTPLMLAADGKCGKYASLALLDLLLEAGAASSAAQKSRNGRTAADIAAARGGIQVAEKLRRLEQPAEKTEAFQRCVYCKGKLRKRSKLAFLGDRVSRREEDNPLVLSLFRSGSECSGGDPSTWNSNAETNAIVNGLDRMEFHRVNSCKHFRKELTESMALIEEVRLLYGRRHHCSERSISTKNTTATTVPSKENDENCNENWKDWHIIDLCSGIACVTGALLLHLMPGCFVTAVDIVGRETLPHFAEAGFGGISDGDDGNGDDGNCTSSSQFSYVQCDIHDPGLIPRLCNRAKLCTANTRSDITAAASTTPTSRSKVHVVVLAMHCCGALSLRAVDIYKALGADAAFVMPCCLPPKAKTPPPKQELGKTVTDTKCTQTNTNISNEVDDETVAPGAGPSHGATSPSNEATAGSANPTTTGSDYDSAQRGIEEEIAHMYTSRNQNEQHRRWSILLKRYAHATTVGVREPALGAGTTMGALEFESEFEVTVRDIPAVLSARRTLISISLRRQQERPQDQTVDDGIL
jgi:hypothetical protein